MQQPHQRKLIRATVIDHSGERVILDLICPKRSDADTIVGRLYPDALYCSTIIKRSSEAKPC